MTSFLISFAVGCTGFFLFTRVLHPRWPIACDLFMVLFFASATVIDLLGRKWPWVPLDIALLALSVYGLRRDWRNRKRRKLAQKLGYKARALRAKLVKTMRDLRQPRRVLRPSPVPS